ncbi:hypothetical protein E1176_07035 [Fulvivirga sp. RKSG066]|uniref:hypothetical protein n=1 Tax=Fulvivirga aurantia TaxID=2529383 RepID=UPI0012BD1565|nr:hypothetical protein [Fulvivirga aurantia]MTI20770.1 hypothetical protein [Fulvivirga aurantia]
MRISSIFELLKDRLWAVRYEGDSTHIFKQLKENWSDASWLQTFFDKHQSDLQSGFFGDIEVDDAAFETIFEADELFEAIEVAEGKDLDDLFEPLDDREFRIKDFQKQKAKGEEHKSWLRIYAVRFMDGYIITGGAIKLTKTMQEREHTSLELKKLSVVRDALRMNEVDDKFEDLD